MFLPALPGWDGLHPLVVHFPIALLLVAPVFVVLGLALPRAGRAALVGALILMVLGTAGAWVATSTGEAGADLVKNAAVEEAIEHHEELAEQVPVVFTILTLAFGVLLIHPLVLRRTASRWLTRVLTIGLLAAYLYGATILANAAHTGGELVHRHGVQARVAATAGAPAPVESGEHDGD